VAAEHIRIGELAKRVGASVRTLRLYEELGIIAPSSRESNNYRLFDARIEGHLRLVDMMLSLGLTLREIKATFAPTSPLTGRVTPTELRAQMTRARAAYQRHLEALDAELERIKSQRRRLRARIAYVDEQLRHRDVVVASPSPTLRRQQAGHMEHLTLTRA
jgi:DNA-binding transcriptional MerR regulator